MDVGSGVRRKDRGRASWIEMLVFLSLRYGIHLADRAGWVPDGLKFLPILGLSWLYFLLTVALVWWRRRCGDSWENLGLGRTAGWQRIVGPALAGVFICFILDGLTSPLLELIFGSSQDLSIFRPLVGSVRLLALMLPLAWIFAAFGEEVFYRGWLMPRLAGLLGGGRGAGTTALLLQAVFFGLAHLYQGAGGMISTGLYGVVYGTLVLRAKGSLGAAVLAHGLIDTVGVLAIYAGALPA